MRKHPLLGGTALLVPVLAWLISHAAAAQDQPPPAEDEAAVEAVVSTGTFIRSPDDLGLPVTVIDRQTLLDQGMPTASDFARSLNETGMVQGEFDPFNSAGGGAASISLRGLGSGRTLVTLNGKRLADEPLGSTLTGGGFQNLSSIPRAALQRIEILKGAGATTYGADAVGGVVNYITRRDLDGTEGSASYRAIENSAGDYDASVLWGRKGDWGNVLVSLDYEHRSPLAANDREFARRAFLQNPKAAANATGFNGWESESNPGAYIFETSGNAPVNVSAAAATALPLNSTFQSIRSGGTGINAFNAAGLLAISPNGIVRDPGCAALGGYGGFNNSTLAAPVCYLRANEPRYLVEETNAYHLFAEANVKLTGKLNLTSNILATTQERPTLHLGASQNIARFPCAPLPANAPANPALTSPGAPAGLRLVNQNCVREVTLAGEGTSTPGASGVGFYSVSGANPAVADFMRRYDVVVGGDAVVDAFREDQVRRVSGRNPATGAYDPSLAPGRVQLLDQLWRPFGVGGNPGFAKNQETGRSAFSTIRLTETLKGDLGQALHARWDFEASATYSHDANVQKDRGILVDRLQRALNGFATNLDEDDGDTCTAAETLGSRTFGNTGAAPTPGVAFTSGAGGGAGAAIAGYAGAGNGCYFFNPFSSAIAANVFSGIDNLAGRDAAPGSPGLVGFAGGVLAGGKTGDQQGYAAGYGLANAPGIVRWLYEGRTQKVSSDLFMADVLLNGESRYRLPGGAIRFALGSQYRETRRKARYGELNDLTKFNCTFAVSELSRPDDIPANPGGVCINGSGGLFVDARLSGRPSQASFPVTAVFGEIALPVERRFIASLSGRYEIAGYDRVPDVDAFIPAATVRWKLTDALALRATATGSFASVVPPEPNTATASTIIPFGGGLATLPVPAEVIAVANTDISPERGSNYSGGLVFQSRGIAASLDYFDVSVSGRATTFDATGVARALTGNYVDGLTASDAIDCGLAAARIFTETSQPILGGRPVVTLQDGRNPCAVGGATLSGAGGVPLSIAYVTRTNTGEQRTTGLDADASWRLPGTLFDGVLILRASGTWSLSWTEGQAYLFGAPVGPGGYDGLGSANLDASRGKTTLGQVSIFRGAAGFTYARAKASLTWSTRYVSGATDDRGYEFSRNGAFSTLAAAVNYNPAEASLCAGQNLVNPDPATNPLGPAGVGVRPYNAACNVTSTAGLKIPGTFNTDVTLRLRLPKTTELSVTVNNLFSRDPPLTRLPAGYNAFGATTSLGRTLKVAASRAF